MNRDELREIVVRPAAIHYLDFQPPSLVDQLIDEVEQTPGALSLLSFTQSELFLKYLERRDAALQTGRTTLVPDVMLLSSLFSYRAYSAKQDITYP